MLSLMEMLPVTLYRRNEDSFPPHLQEDTVWLLLTCCCSQQLTSKYRSIMRQDDAMTNVSLH